MNFIERYSIIEKRLVNDVIIIINLKEKRFTM